MFKSKYFIYTVRFHHRLRLLLVFPSFSFLKTTQIFPPKKKTKTAMNENL
jgi:hypothetical protein